MLNPVVAIGPILTFCNLDVLLAPTLDRAERHLASLMLIYTSRPTGRRCWNASYWLRLSLQLTFCVTPIWDRLVLGNIMHLMAEPLHRAENTIQH